MPKHAIRDEHPHQWVVTEVEYKTVKVQDTNPETGELLFDPATKEPIMVDKQIEEVIRRQTVATGIVNDTEAGALALVDHVRVPPTEGELLARDKLSAVSQIHQRFAKLTVRITGPVPSDEKISWPVKADAARAILNGNATVDQIALITTEATATGETENDLAASIVAKADAYAVAIGGLTGWRRISEKAITAALDRAAVQTVLEAALAEQP